MLWMKSLLDVRFVTPFFILINSFLGSCTNDDGPIKCVSEFIVSSVEIEKIDSFTHLKGIDVWRNWEYLTSSIAEEYEEAENCGLYEYMDHYNESLDSVHGGMFFVYSVHSYLKYGYVDEEKVVKKVDRLLNEN